MQLEELQQARVLVTGADGFLGTHLIHRLRELNVEKIYPVGRFVDLRIEENLEREFDEHRPHFVFHLAGYNGNIDFNAKEPAKIFRNNTLMALNVLECCSLFNVKKVVSTITSCGYPQFVVDYCEMQLCEEEYYLQGPPNPTVACHAYAKRNLMLASIFYNEQYSLQAVCVCPPTLYGPGDRTDLGRTKVVGAMVQRFVEAKQQNAPSVTCWGTGTPFRHLLYVEDAAKLIVQSMLDYDDCSLPLNVGYKDEVSIKELAYTVAGLVGYEGDVLWDSSMPDGQRRKFLDTSRMSCLKQLFEPTRLEEGLRKTINELSTV